MPRPLSQVHPNAPYPLGTPTAVHDYPHLTAKAMQVLAVYSTVELMVTNMVCRLVDAEYEKVVIMLNAIHETARSAAIRELARHSVAEDAFDLLVRTLKRVEPLRKTRNTFAHHLWYRIHDLPFEAIALVNPKVLSFKEARTHQAFSKPNTMVTLGEINLTVDDVIVWDVRDLDQAIALADEVVSLVSLLARAIEDHPGSPQARALLKERLGVV